MSGYRTSGIIFGWYKRRVMLLGTTLFSLTVSRITSRHYSGWSATNCAVSYQAQALLETGFALKEAIIPIAKHRGKSQSSAPVAAATTPRITMTVTGASKEHSPQHCMFQFVGLYRQYSTSTPKYPSVLVDSRLPWSNRRIVKILFHIMQIYLGTVESNSFVERMFFTAGLVWSENKTR